MRALRIAAGVLLLSAPFADAVADVLLSTSTRTGFNDLAAWPGTCAEDVGSIVTVSTNGVGVTATTTSTISTTTQRQPDFSGGCAYDGWFGNFAPGDNLAWAWDGASGTGPITLDLSQGVSGIGTQFMADYYGPFVARLEVFNGATSLGFFTAAGNSNGDADNSAVFLGIFDLTGPNITRAVLSIDSCTFDCADFTINQVSLLVNQAPAPGTLALLALGVLAFGIRFRRSG